MATLTFLKHCFHILIQKILMATFATESKNTRTYIDKTGTCADSSTFLGKYWGRNFCLPEKKAFCLFFFSFFFRHTDIPRPGIEPKSWFPLSRNGDSQNSDYLIDKIGKFHCLVKTQLFFSSFSLLSPSYP